jgi:hypothetical protein
MRYGPWSASCSYLGMGPYAPLPLNIATVFDDGSTSDVAECGVSWYLSFTSFMNGVRRCPQEIYQAERFSLLNASLRLFFHSS